MKKVRKAVRTFLINNDEVLTIKYINDNQYGYYDIPGGKIEGDETSEQAAIREFKEETGINIYNPKYAGNLIIQYPNRIFDFDVFIASNFDGDEINTLENTTEWIKITDLIKEEKIFGSIKLLDENYIQDLINFRNFKFYFISDENHNIIREFY